MIKGTVKWFNNQKGYGFITGDDGTDVFVHYTGISCDGFKKLDSGDKVQFELQTTDGKTQAINVVKLS